MDNNNHNNAHQKGSHMAHPHDDLHNQNGHNANRVKHIKDVSVGKWLAMLFGPMLVIVIFAYMYVVSSRYVSTDNAYVKLGIASVASEVSGTVLEVTAKNNQRVDAGEVLFAIDDSLYKIAYNSAEAGLTEAINQVNNLKSSYIASQSKLVSANADLDFSTKQYNRYLDLSYKQTIAEADLDKAKQQMINAQEAVKITQQSMEQVLASLDGNINLPIEQYSIYRKVRSLFDKASKDLEHTVVRAPFSGVVSNLYLKKGTFVASGVPVCSFVDASDIWVEANFKETQLTSIKPGQKAKIKIDSYPDLRLMAYVMSITPASGAEFSILPAQNSSGNWIKVSQRVMVKLHIEQQHHHELPSLASGMSAEVEIDLDSLRL